MSMFPLPSYPIPDNAEIEKMKKDFGAALPKDMAAAFGLMTNPVAGAAAMSVVGLSLASHAFGVWVGAVEASQRLFAPLSLKDETVAPVPVAVAAPTVAKFTKPKPVLKVIATTEPVPTVGLASKPKAGPAPKSEAAAKAVARAEPSAKSVQRTPPAETAAVNPATQAVAAAPAINPQPAAAPAGTPLMPEDFRKPRSFERPTAPDDLKAIAGIGPKLEKVLNELGVWTYAQLAGWSSQEVAWVDDYLSFSGRIGRDKWIEQASRLALAAGAKSDKG